MSPAWLVAAGGILAATAVLIVAALIATETIRVTAAPPPAPVSVPGGAPAGPPAQRADIAPGAARYEVLGDGPASVITYAIEQNDSDVRDQGLPWYKSTGADYLALTARRGSGPGSITCRITGFGRVLAEQTARGPYATCTASEIASE